MNSTKQSTFKIFINTCRMILAEILLGWIVSLCPKDDKDGRLLLGFIVQYFQIALATKNEKEN